jgi:REP element-mobilizing transposase RayT
LTWYRRNLPHWHPDGAAIFLTWRLHGAIDCFRPPAEARTPGQRFIALDRALDHAVTGARWLGEPAVGDCVVEALRFGERHLRLYALVAWCVMPNHVHLVVEPQQAISRITKSIKGYTARSANRLLGRRGEPFWQDESYDHWIRNEDERNRIVRYVERNPVAAALVKDIEGWRWSSAANP